MGMEALSLLNFPKWLALRELRMHLIAYNLIRGLMQEAATQESTRLERSAPNNGAVDHCAHSFQGVERDEA